MNNLFDFTDILVHNDIFIAGGIVMLFGDRLRKLREDKEITQKDLGKIINTSNRVIGYYESNDRFPRDEKTLITLADYFGVSVDYLIGHTNIKSPISDYIAESKIAYNLDIDGLPEEAVNMIQEYIELVRLKYNPKRKTNQ
jgi:transcriptional regulator with XRE-family HTH domain